MNRTGCPGLGEDFDPFKPLVQARTKPPPPTATRCHVRRSKPRSRRDLLQIRNSSSGGDLSLPGVYASTRPVRPRSARSTGPPSAWTAPHKFSGFCSPRALLSLAGQGLVICRGPGHGLVSGTQVLSQQLQAHLRCEGDSVGMARSAAGCGRDRRVFQRLDPRRCPPRL